MAEADGQDPAELVEQLTTVSQLGEALSVRSPAEVQELQAGNFLSPTAPESLGTAGIDPEATAALAGIWSPPPPGDSGAECSGGPDSCDGGIGESDDVGDDAGGGSM